MAQKPTKTLTSKPEPKTTGHSWDGIEEYDNPMPRWWLWTFYATIIWGVLFMIAYPAWPLISGATPGLLGYSTRSEVAADIGMFSEANGEIAARLAAADVTAIASDAVLQSYAVNAGAAVFKTSCIQCHGAGAAGTGIYPNLIDDDWLWGGNIDDIALTIRHGIRSAVDDDTRFSQMPAFGDFLEEQEITGVANFVRALGGLEHDAAMAARGAVVFEENCASCHGADGTGERELGAPNLTDFIWLFGGDIQALTHTITIARNSEMPAWQNRLTDAQIKAVSVYVHQLGGGE
ncbi:MAG: cytochrome-c oxidase, cbb3-type subunit III [Paracoccaceae bacterium]